MKQFALSAALFALPFTGFVSAADPVKVEVTGNDQMQFSTKVLEGKVGETMEITFKHIGKLPKEAMGHNLVILKAGTVAPTIAMKCMTAKATDYVSEDAEVKAAVIAHTKVLGPGESETIKFTPTEAGVYPFICTFLGHFGVMNGTITVK